MGKLEWNGGLRMATPSEGSAEPTVEQSSKEDSKPPAEAEQQKDVADVTPKAASEAEAQKKDDDNRLRSKSRSLSPEPELGEPAVLRTVLAVN